MRNYELRRSARRSLSLEVTPELTLLVRAPERLPRREIDAFVARHEGWIAEHLERQRRRLAAYPPVTPEEERELRRRAKAELPERVARFSALMGLVPTGIRITSAEKRFGSCSGKNSLCFSWRLMRYPPEAIDYVVVHELAHIAHKDHSRAFYARIAQVLPDYRQRQKLLQGEREDV